MLQAKVGTFATNQLVGPQSITGLGFTPKLLVIQSDKQWTNDPSYFSYNGQFSIVYSFAAVDQNLNHRLVGHNKVWAQHTSGTPLGYESIFSYMDNNNAIHTCNDPPTPTDWFVAQVQSLDADGFTVYNSVAPTGAHIDRVGWWALGGDSISATKVGTFYSSFGTQAVTGIGFKPDLIILFSQLLPTDNTTRNSFFSHCFGMANATQQFAYCSASQKLSTNHHDDATCGDTGQVFVALDSNLDSASSPAYIAQLVSFDADGFTLNWLASSGSIAIGYIAIKGALSDIGTWLTPASLSNTSLHTSNQPLTIFMASPNLPSLGNVISYLNESVGYGYCMLESNNSTRSFCCGTTSGHFASQPNVTGQAGRTNASYHYPDDTGGIRPHLTSVSGLDFSGQIHWYVGGNLNEVGGQPFPPWGFIMSHDYSGGPVGYQAFLSLGSGDASFGFMT